MISVTFEEPEKDTPEKKGVGSLIIITTQTTILPAQHKLSELIISPSKRPYGDDDL